MHVLPADAIDVAAWEAALHPTVSSPAELSRILKGEWNVGMQQCVLPLLSSTGDPEPPPDPAKFIDVRTEMYRRVINANASMNPKDLSTFTIPPTPSSAGLSQESRSFYDNGIMITEGTKSWRKGWVRAQSIEGLMQAAFAIMKGQPVPDDPIHGLPYVWDPVTRTLAQPNDKLFEELECKPITVPQR